MTHCPFYRLCAWVVAVAALVAWPFQASGRAPDRLPAAGVLDPRQDWNDTAGAAINQFIPF